MATPSEFAQRIAQLRSGQPDAIQAFVAQYEPYIRRTIRFRINRAALCAVTDSTDVCQSVLGGFLLRLSTGEFDLQSEEDLRRLLLVIAQRKFTMIRRREFSAKRSRKITRSLNDVPEVEASSSSDPFASFEFRELADLVKCSLTPSEFELLCRRRDGQSWEAIALDIGEEAVTLRKRLSRALRRVASELGLEY